MVAPVIEQIGVQLFNNTTKPRFSGESRDWQNFARDWEEYLALVKQIVPQGFSEEILLRTLQGCLDEGTVLELQLMKSQTPQFSYKLFWGHLCKIHGYNIATQNRRLWKSVRLDCPKGRLTKSVFMKFRAQFILARDKVSDRSSTEERNLLNLQLPAFWRDRITKEEIRRKNLPF